MKCLTHSKHPINDTHYYYPSLLNTAHTGWFCLCLNVSQGHFRMELSLPILDSSDGRINLPKFGLGSVSSQVQTLDSAFAP